jgi:hypothetical protein
LLSTWRATAPPRSWASAAAAASLRAMATTAPRCWTGPLARPSWCVGAEGGRGGAWSGGLERGLGAAAWRGECCGAQPAASPLTSRLAQRPAPNPHPTSLHHTPSLPAVQAAARRDGAAVHRGHQRGPRAAPQAHGCARRGGAWLGAAPARVGPSVARAALKKPFPGPLPAPLRPLPRPFGVRPLWPPPPPPPPPRPTPSPALSPGEGAALEQFCAFLSGRQLPKDTQIVLLWPLPPPGHDAELQAALVAPGEAKDLVATPPEVGWRGRGRPRNGRSAAGAAAAAGPPPLPPRPYARPRHSTCLRRHPPLPSQNTPTAAHQVARPRARAV